MTAPAVSIEDLALGSLSSLLAERGVTILRSYCCAPGRVAVEIAPAGELLAARTIATGEDFCSALGAALSKREGTDV